MNLNRKTFWLMISGVVFLGGISYAIWFLYSEIDDASKAIADASVNFALLQEKEKEFDESSKNLQKYSAEIDNLDGTFLREETFVDLLRLVEELARTSGVSFKALGAKVPTAADDKAVLSFELAGEKEPLVRFFILLDNIPYSGIVDGISWTRQGKSSDQVKVSASYLIFNYIK